MTEWLKMTKVMLLCSYVAQTWLYCTPVETPTAMSVAAKIPEVNPHGIGVGQKDWWLEVVGVRWRVRGEAAALVHQDGAVPISHYDMVACAIGDRARDVDLEVSELKP